MLRGATDRFTSVVLAGGAAIASAGAARAAAKALSAMRTTPARVHDRRIVTVVIAEPLFHMNELAPGDQGVPWGDHLLGSQRNRRGAPVGFHLIDGSKPLANIDLGTVVRRRFHSEVTAMSNGTLLLLIVVLVLLFGGGGGYYWRRSRG
jgi:hypothetical protein